MHRIRNVHYSHRVVILISLRGNLYRLRFYIRPNRQWSFELEYHIHISITLHTLTLLLSSHFHLYNHPLSIHILHPPPFTHPPLHHTTPLYSPTNSPGAFNQTNNPPNPYHHPSLSIPHPLPQNFPTTPFLSLTQSFSNSTHPQLPFPPIPITYPHQSHHPTQPPPLNTPFPKSTPYSPHK